MIYLGNFFGLVAIILFVLSYQLKNRKEIIVCNTVSRFFYVLQYLLLGAFAGAVVDIIATAISAVVTKRNTTHKKSKIVVVSMLYALIVVASIMFYKDVFSVFSFLGVTFELAAFLFGKEKSVRIMSLVGQPFWMVYNCHYMAWSSLVGNVIAMVSIIIGLYRYDFKNINENEKE